MNRFFSRPVRLSITAGLFALSTLALAVSNARADTPFFSTLHNFSRSDGSYPLGHLIQGSDGDFYGTTANGGTSTPPGGSGSGTVFKITPAGTLTTLYNFAAPTSTDHGYVNQDGAYPQANLVEGSDGDFYGTTQQGGPAGNGTIFKITPSGTLTTLVYFSDKTGIECSALVLGSDGNFYGTAFAGGPRGGGTVFKTTPTGKLTVLYNFTTAGANGKYPSTGLVQGADGDFYGATAEGGANGTGTIFKVTPGGTLTTIHSFAYDGTPEGFDVRSALIQVADGDFYGTASYGGAAEGGTIFKITPSGTLTVLYNFPYSTSFGGYLDGAHPYDGFVQDIDGNFYGTTTQGGSSGGGTVFKITPFGVLTTLVNFAYTDGYYPQAGLSVGGDGNLYGAAEEGGPSYSLPNNSYGYGTIFRVNPAAVPSALSFFPASGPVGSTVTITGTNVDFRTVTAVRFHDASARVFSASADGSFLTVTVPTGVLKGTITVTTPSGPVVTSAPFRVTYAPVIASFSPISGPVGTVVTITGTHLTGITRVRFHNASATIYVSNTDGTQLTVTVPNGADSGTITLDNRDALATTSSGVFTVTP